MSFTRATIANTPTVVFTGIIPKVPYVPYVLQIHAINRDATQSMNGYITRASDEGTDYAQSPYAGWDLMAANAADPRLEEVILQPGTRFKFVCVASGVGSAPLDYKYGVFPATGSR